jgi:hypothetical protein
MASLNKRTKKEYVGAAAPARQVRAVTHGGTLGFAPTDGLRQLRRLVGATLLWEKQFYVDGVDIATQIRNAVAKTNPADAARVAIDAREINKLRHAPLLIVREMARLATHKHLVADTLAQVIQRPDEITEFLAIYWRDELPVQKPRMSKMLGFGRAISRPELQTVMRKQPLSAQVKRGLAQAFLKFNEYSLAKYDRDGEIKLRDVLFLVHAKPTDGVAGYTKEARKAGVQPPTLGSELFAKIATRTLATPDTWEVSLSAGADKKETFERLLTERKLGGLALLRNLRNMEQAGVNRSLIRAGLEKMDTSRILPFRFIAAARFAPHLEPELEAAMFRTIAAQEKLPGTTKVLVDVSGSMDAALSEKSDMRRMDAAYGVAMVLRERAENVEIYTFSDLVKTIPNRRGFALRDAMDSSQAHYGTRLAGAVTTVNGRGHYDRIVVITDEQATDSARVKPLPGAKGYVINVASYKNGLSFADWVKIDGFSEAVINYIADYEKNQL